MDLSCVSWQHDLPLLHLGGRALTGSWAVLHMDEEQKLRHPRGLRHQETVRHLPAIVQASRAGTEAGGPTMTPNVDGLEFQIREYTF